MMNTIIRSLQLHRITRALKRELTSLNRSELAVAGLVFLLVFTMSASRQRLVPVASLQFNERGKIPLDNHRVSFTPAPSNQTRRRLANAAAPSGQSTVKKPHFFTVLVPLYERASAQFGVDPKLLAAVHYVESGFSGDTAVTSSAGAQGPMQFMPGTFRKYGVDANGDGSAKITSLEDSVFAAAHLLAANGAAAGQVDRALFAYNHSQHYVNTVKDIENKIQFTP